MTKKINIELTEEQIGKILDHIDSMIGLSDDADVDRFYREFEEDVKKQLDKFWEDSKK